MDKKRVEHIDILKGIGIIYMIFGHVYFGECFDIYIHGFHMPIFFFVAGYFFSSKKYNNFFAFFIHEIKTLLLPYTIFVFVCQPLHYIYTGKFSFQYFFLSYFTSNFNRIDVAGAYWFLLCLFTLRVLFYFIDLCLESDVVKIVIIISCSLFGCLCSVKLPLCLNSAMAVVPLIYLGQLSNKYKDTIIIKDLSTINPFFIIMLLTVGFVLIQINGNVNNRTNHYSNIILYWINCLTALLCYWNISVRISGFKGKATCIIRSILRYIGKNSIVFLVFNEFVIFAVSYVTQFIIKFAKLNIDYFTFYPIKFLVALLAIALLEIIAFICENTKIKVIFGRF